jgi:hypothetical protein
MLEIQLPKIAGQYWSLSVDTGKSAPVDIIEFSKQTAVIGGTYKVSGRSVVVFESKA